MSLITRCPICATTFKVLPDQLRISDGWVRCGRCGEIFDAPVNMCEPSDPGNVSGSLLPADSLAPMAEHDDEPSNATGRAVIDAQWWQGQPSLDMPVSASDPIAHDEARDSTHVGIGNVTDAHEAPVMAFRVTADEGIPKSVTSFTPPFMPGFVKPKPPSTPSRPKNRVRFVVLAVVAFVALLLQIAFQERDLIAARQPALKPLLTSLCRVVGCQVSEPRQIASITVDGASFSREAEGDGYRLHFSLRSSAPVALKMPAIELTLLDTQKRPVLRRVLLPGDFGAPTVLAPHAAHAAALRLVLNGPEAATLPPFADYRIVPFYP